MEDLSSFFALRKQQSSHHENPIKPPNLDMDTLLEDIDSTVHNEEIKSCKVSLIDSEFQKGRHSVFISNTSLFNNFVINENMDHVYSPPKYAAKVNFAIKFPLKNSEDGTCRTFSAQKNKTFLEKSKHLCTQIDMVNSRRNLWKTDFV